MKTEVLQEESIHRLNEERIMLPEYLDSNCVRIKNLEDQVFPAWSKAYDHDIFCGEGKFPIMKEINKRFPEKIINRAGLTALFTHEDTLYLGFVAAMIWGFINATRTRGKDKEDKTQTDFYRALNHPQERVIASIKSTEKYLLKGDFINPFMDMLPGGKHKIPGIDHAYFTKIFFFIGQANNAIEVKPIIFDKWTKNAFFALLTQSYPDERSQYFASITIDKNPVNPGSVNLRTNVDPMSKIKIQAQAYERFVRLINEWSKELGVTPDKLEQFIFGWDLRKNNRYENPRVQLWQIFWKI